MRQIRLLIPLIAMTGFLLGCGGGVKEETIEVKPIDPMTQVKSTLMNYVNGQPMGSEASGFDYMITEVEKADPAKAKILKAGLDDLKKANGAALRTKARDLMKKLGLSVAS